MNESLMVKDSPAAAVKVAVVIPTRNRSTLAINAIRSLLNQPGCQLQILVSDNSSQAEDLEQLERFCRQLGDARVVYVRPPEVLPQAAHWDWALQHALARFDAGYFTILYDRKIIKPGHFHYVTDAVARHPGRLMIYLKDAINGNPAPVRLWQAGGSGSVFAVQTARILELVAQGKGQYLGQAIPLLSNCLVPRQVLAAVQAKFGTICNSTTPDTCFAFRFCALYDQYLVLERSLGILYAAHRSTGFGYWRGQHTGDFADFVTIWGERPWLDAAPIPGLTLGNNIVFHEYSLVQRVIGTDRLPAIEMDGYLRQLALGLPQIKDRRLRAAQRALLEEHGWDARIPITGVKSIMMMLAPPEIYAWAGGWARRAHAAWQRFVLFLADHFGVRPANISGASFPTNAAAIRYALKYPRRTSSRNDYFAVLHAVPIGDEVSPELQHDVSLR